MFPVVFVSPSTAPFDTTSYHKSGVNWSQLIANATLTQKTMRPLAPINIERFIDQKEKKYLLTEIFSHIILSLSSLFL
jgi:hypothetical protein